MNKGIGLLGCIIIMIVYFITIIGTCIIGEILNERFQISIDTNVYLLMTYIIVFIFIRARFHIYFNGIHEKVSIQSWLLVVAISVLITIVTNYIKMPISFEAFNELSNQGNIGIKEKFMWSSLYTSSENNKEFMIDLIKVLFVTIIFPILEEILFRGYIFRGLNIKYNFIIAAIISSILFAVLHSLTDIKLMGGVFISALIWCLMLVWTENIGVCMVAHIINNILGLVFTCIGKYGMHNKLCMIINNNGETHLAINPMVVIISGGICILLVSYMSYRFHNIKSLL